MSSDPFAPPESPKSEPSPQPVKPMYLPLPQFSIWTVIVATAFFLLAASHWWTSVRLQLARNEIVAIRRSRQDEISRVRRGVLPQAIMQSQKTHVAYLAHASSYYWQWRVHIPAHAQYRLYLALDYPFDHARDENDWNVILKPGDGIITFQVVRTPQDTFEVVRTIDWLDYNTNGLPTRTIATWSIDPSQHSVTNKSWDNLTPQSFSLQMDGAPQDLDAQFQVKELKDLGQEYYLKYDPRDLIVLSSDIYIWLEPVKD